jgi:hypothetical protein
MRGVFQQPANGGRTAAWMVWILALVGPPIVAALLGANAGSVGEAFGEAIGAAIGLAVIGAIALIFVKSGSGRQTLGIVLGLVLCLAEIPRVMQQVANRELVHASARNLQNALEARTSNVPHGPASDSSAQTAATTAAESAASTTSSVLDLTADLVNDEKRLVEQLQNANQALRAESLLAPTTLTDAGRMREGRRRINNWEHFLDSYKGSADQLLGDYWTKVASLHLTDADRASFESNYKIGRDRSEQALERYLRVEHLVGNEVLAVYAFMGDRIGLVEISDGKLVFPTTADSEVYAAHFDRLQKLAAEETEAQKAMLKLNEQGMAKLKDVARQAGAE